MKNKHKSFRQSFKENFLMQQDLKSGIIAKNLHRLAQLEQILFSFGIIMCTFIVVRYHSDFRAHLLDFIYYFGYIFSSVLVLLFAIRTTHHPEWPVWRRNQPTYLAIFSLLVLSVSLLYFSKTPLSSYTVYVNASIITIVTLAVEPLFFIILLTISLFFITSKLYEAGSIPMIINMCITTLIMICLSLFKWNSLIKEFTLEKVRTMHFESMQKEIELAAFVQESFTKKRIPELDNYDISFYSKAMAGVSGDMYDFYTQGTTLKGVGIFDVSGHGIASGLVTMLVRNIFQQEFFQNSDKKLSEIMEIIDKRIKNEKHDIENYLTGILLRIKGKKIEIVNAGHPSPIIYRKTSGECTFFDEKRQFSSSVVGLSAIDAYFNQTEFEMASGDELILFTDGVKEALNSEHAEYGSNRILNSVHNAVQNDFENQIHTILSDMGHFTENTEQSDDITIVIIRKK